MLDDALQMKTPTLLVGLAAMTVVGCTTPFDPYYGEGEAQNVISIRSAVENDQDYDGRVVSFRQVVVLAEDTNDETGAGNVGNVYLSDPGNAPGTGLQLFAPIVQLPAYESLSPGDIVDARGEFVVFAGPPGSTPFMGRVVHQLGQGASVDRVGFWQGPEPIELTPAEFLANPSRYQGSLITLRNLTATNAHEITYSSSGRARLRPFSTEERIDVSGELYQIRTEAGTRITRLTGIANYFYSDFIMPRSAADVELAAP